MTALKIGLKVDTFLQGISIMIIAACLVAFALNHEYGWMPLTALSLLGIIQILSAIILNIATKDKKRGKHLLHIIYYWLGYICILPLLIGIARCCGMLFNMELEFTLGSALLYIFGVPVFLAIRYFKFTITDMVKVNSLHRSFWDI